MAAAGDLEDALPHLLQVIADRQIGWEDQEEWILAHYDLGRLYEAQADTARAVDAYANFLDIWREADRDIPSVIDARKRVAALTGEVGDPS